MSLFLIYFEIGKPIDRHDTPHDLIEFPVKIRNADRISVPARKGVAITDGVASDRFKQYGKHVAGREGSVLRDALFEYIVQRVKAGATPCLSFCFVEGELGTVDLPIDKKQRIYVADLPEIFPELGVNQVVEIIKGNPL